MQDRPKDIVFQPATGKNLKPQRKEIKSKWESGQKLKIDINQTLWCYNFNLLVFAIYLLDDIIGNGN